MKNLKTNIIVLILFGLAVLYFSLKDDFGNIMSQIYEINFWWFLLACFMMFMYFVFRAFEMQDLVRLVDKDYPYRKALGIAVMGQFFANITPSSLGTQPAQIYFLNKDKIKASDGTRIVIQYNVTYQIAMIVISLMAIWLVYQYGIFDDLKTTLALKELVVLSLLIHVGVLIVLLVVNYAKNANSFIVQKTIKVLSFFRLIRDRKKVAKEWAEYLNDFHDDSRSILGNKKLFIRGLIYSFLAITCMYITPIFLVYAMGDFTSLKAIESIIASSYTTVISVFMPSPGGIGAFEYFFTQFFGVFITGASLLSLMLLWRLVTYYFVLLVGFIILIFNQERII